tara:strand:+ start:11264 stop:11653 length:390 start_codon:yes stop_codon:yes gene_type:complete
MSSREIIEELEIDQFKELLKNIGNKIIIVKFTAEWCKPCKKIQPLVNESFNKLNDTFVIFEIDIDETMELYYALKTKKMVNGIPSILAYYGNENRDVDKWYIPSDSVIGGNESEVKLFFDRCQIKGATM